MNGTVKWFSTEKGYGFITSDSGEDHYYRVTGVKGSDLPINGDRVAFESNYGEKGPVATGVCIVTKSANRSTSRDDRIKCPECGKAIVPRIITDRGSLSHSVCPFCGTQIKYLADWYRFLVWLIKTTYIHPIIMLSVFALLILTISIL